MSILRVFDDRLEHLELDSLGLDWFQQCEFRDIQRLPAALDFALWQGQPQSQLQAKFEDTLRSLEHIHSWEFHMLHNRGNDAV